MLARFFVDRPIAAWVVSIVIVLMGAITAFRLPIAQYPDITPPTVQVTAIYPGASAVTVANSVAAPIEEQVNGVERMLYMSSQCTNDGAYTLTITFELGTDLNMAQVLVQNRVSLAMPKLPQQVQVQGVNTKKKSPSILLVVNLISPDDSYDDLYLSNYATIQVKDQLLRIPGVGDVTYLGQRDYSMRIWLNPERMANLGISTRDVMSAVQSQNVQVAAGQIGQQPVPEGQQFQLPMSTLGRLETEKEFGDIILKSAPPSAGQTSVQVVRVRDVARIELGSQQFDQICRLDGQASVGLAIFQLPGSNALQVADQIKDRMEELKKRFPAGVDYRIVYDTTPFIKQSVEEVFVTLRDAVILVAIVVLFFLQDWKAMILPMIDVPVSLVGTFAVMAVLGFTLNNLTLFGLVLAIGIVVDDAIVVLENIERLIATGLGPREATIKAMDEVTGPIIAITLILCSVFLPCAFIPGVTGEFYRQFALTIASAMVISAVNAMTLTPARAVSIFQSGDHAHSREALPWWFFAFLGGVVSYKFGAPWSETLAKLIASEGRTPAAIEYGVMALLFLPGFLAGGALGWFIIKPVNAFLAVIFKGFNGWFDRVTVLYGKLVGRMLRLSFLVLLAYGGLLVMTGWTMATAPSGFIPLQDQGYLLLNVQLPDSASVQRTRDTLAKIDRMVLGDDQEGKFKGPPAAKGAKRFKGIEGVAHTNTVAGQSFLLNANGSNFGSMFVILEDFDERRSHDRYDEVIAGKIMKLCAEEIEEGVVQVFRAPPIQGLGSAGGFKFQVEQRGFMNLPELQKATDALIQKSREDRRFAGMGTMFRAETPQLFIDIDRTKCEANYVAMDDVFNTLQVYMGGMYVNLFNKFGRTWQVNLMADQQYRTDPEAIKQLKVRNKLGEMVPLSTLGQIENRAGPVMVMRYNMFPSASVNGAGAPGVSSGETIQAVDELANDQSAPYEWTEITFLQILAGNVTAYVFALGSFLVYLVLAFKYESWKLPAAVILVVPLCLLASVTGMLIMHLPVDIFVQIGFLVLVGLAAKNAVLIVEFAEQKRVEGQSLYDATVASCRDRVRPIVMTSFAFILGVLPLVISHGAGAEMRRSLGTAVFAGMTGVTFFGIFLTPVFYYVLEMWGGEKKKTPAGKKPPE